MLAFCGPYSIEHTGMKTTSKPNGPRLHNVGLRRVWRIRHAVTSIINAEEKLVTCVHTSETAQYCDLYPFSFSDTWVWFEGFPSRFLFHYWGDSKRLRDSWKRQVSPPPQCSEMQVSVRDKQRILFSWLFFGASIIKSAAWPQMLMTLAGLAALLGPFCWRHSLCSLPWNLQSSSGSRFRFQSRLSQPYLC